MDLSRPWISYGVVSPWNSAAFASVADMRRRWADHGYVPLYMEPRRIEQVAIDRVTLSP